MNVLARGQNEGVANGVSARTGLHVGAVKRLGKSTDLVVLDNLLQAVLEVLERLLQGQPVNGLELGPVEALEPGVLGEAKGLAELGHDICAKAAIGAGGPGNEGAHHGARRGNDILVKLDAVKVAFVVASVDFLDVAANRPGEDGWDALDRRLVLRPVDLRNVDKGSNALLRRGGHAHDVEATGQET